MRGKFENYLIVLTCLVVLGCTSEAPENPVFPEVIRVAVLPDQAPENLISRHRPLLDYLERKTAIRFELAIPTDYEDFLRAFEAGEVDLGWFGGLTFVRAAQHGNAVPVVFRDIDLQFTSCYLSRTSSARASISAFEGAAFSFGPELSTSGHLMPRYFLARSGIVPEDFFSSVRYSIGHDQTAAWVADGTVELGVANCVIVQSLLNGNQLNGEELVVLDTTPPYSDYVWAVQPSMKDSTRLVILDAFLALDATVPTHREVLQRQGANAYLPADREDFATIQTAAEQAGLLADDSQP